MTNPPDATLEAVALLLGERIDLRGYDPPGAVSQLPLAFAAEGGLVVVYRFGAVVFFGVAQTSRDRIVADLLPRVVEPAAPMEMETALLAGGAPEDGLVASGRVGLIDFAQARLLIVADVLAKSVALADDERYVTKVFEQIEPFAHTLAERGGAGLASSPSIKLLGEALVAQARMVGRVEALEKPDQLWDQPELQRLFSRLEDEYELEDRARVLSRKLKVIEECASTLSDVSDQRRMLRLEAAIVILITFDIVLSLYDRAMGIPH